MKRRIFVGLLAIAFIAFVGGAVHNLVGNHNKVQLQDVQLQDRSAQIKQLQVKYNLLNKQLDGELKSDNVNQDQVKQQQQQIQDYQKQIQDLQAQLQARAEQKSQSVASRAASTIVGTASADSGTSDAKMWIYLHESGNNPGSVAGNGACGLGQALPCSKLPCSLSDYACQDQWFTSYMQSRYGTWENAEALWKSRASYYGGDWHGGWW